MNTPRTTPMTFNYRLDATPELCQLVSSLIASADVSPEATLSDIREVVVGEGIFVSDGELLHPQDRTFLVIEIDELIEQHGSQAAVRDFTGLC